MDPEASSSQKPPAKEEKETLMDNDNAEDAEGIIEEYRKEMEEIIQSGIGMENMRVGVTRTFANLEANLEPKISGLSQAVRKTKNETLEAIKSMFADFKASVRKAAETALEAMEASSSKAPLPKDVRFQVQTLPVKTSDVTDGDSFRIYVRTSDLLELPQFAEADERSLQGIDAPEQAMEFGTEAKKELARIVRGQTLTLDVYKQDDFRRWVADIYTEDGTFVQRRVLLGILIVMIRARIWHGVNEAQAKKVGMWGSSTPPEKPWKWRHRQNSEAWALHKSRESQ
ncbi:unnamed protein product [Thlaspi arvense]|uniref:TNase-like domain-containing protein n=1 Tax=Thlaspi arvense TaxID=13288 RepID=A0AAU9S6N5_THLAR|nr:unnamed protein product [Thlaspi arvense]